VDVPGTFGRYEIAERVGRGGMGVLYRGKDTVLDREVAIKVMSGDFSGDEAARGRFFREARAAARLQHRNIVTIFEFAEDEHGTPYIAMEFLRGRSLSARMAQDPPLTLIQKLDIMVQLCTGLHYAHEQGIVHRDVKPANIWLMDDGTIKLLDFGIAKIASSTMTSVGSVVGSASYMAPEQVAGREIDGRADVFSAGVVLYEMLSGRKPFEGEGPTAVMMKIVKDDPPPLREYAPTLPATLVEAVDRALQKDPEKRFPHAGDFGAELRLIRLAVERTSDTLSEGAEGATMYVAPQVAATAKAAHSASFPHDPAAGASISRAALPAPAAARAPFATWIAVAAVAVAVVLAAIVYVQRPSSPPPATTTTSTNPADPPNKPPAEGGPVAAATVKLVTDPDGAKVLIDGRDVGLVTPVDVAIADVTHSRVRVTKAGYRTADVRAAETQIKNGMVLVKLDAAPTSITVTVSGSYPFEVLDGSRVISAASTRHELSVPGPRTLRLRAADYMLDAPLRAESASGRVSYTVPEPGRLTIRTPLETCEVSINNRAVGFPPISDQKLAAGNYRVQLSCPDGSERKVSVTIAPGQPHIEVIR
jgi:serine/threonine-protein kinase